MSEPPSLGEWPEHFPPACPPVDARELSDCVYYLVNHDPCQRSDFSSAAERGVFPTAPECERAALSCGLSLTYIRGLKAAVARLRFYKVAMGELLPIHGKLKQTGRPGHYSMYLRAAWLERATELFKVCDEN